MCWVFDFADYENFYPKEKKEIPKGNGRKSESKGEIFLLFSAAIMVVMYAFLFLVFENLNLDIAIAGCLK